jgi:midasin
MQRYSTLSKALGLGQPESENAQLLNHVVLDNLSWSDISLLSRFARAMESKSSALAIPFSIACEQYLQLCQSQENTKFRVAMGEMLNKFAAKTGLRQGFRDAQVSDRALSFIDKICTDSMNKIRRSSILSKIHHWCLFFSNP